MNMQSSRLQMCKAMLILIICVILAPTTGGQSVEDLRAKYRSITSYEIHPGVVMTPQYAADGHVCEMVLERRHETESGFKTADTFTDSEVTALVDELVPQSERGKAVTNGPLQDDRPNAYGAGGIMVMNTPYEYVIVQEIGVTKPKPGRLLVATITWRKRACSGAR